MTIKKCLVAAQSGAPPKLQSKLSVTLPTESPSQPCQAQHASGSSSVSIHKSGISNKSSSSKVLPARTTHTHFGRVTLCDTTAQLVFHKLE